MASGGWEQHGGAAGAAGAGSCRGAKRRIWSRERSPGRAEEAAAVRVQGTLAAVASQQSKCLRRRLRSGGGGSRDRGNRGAAAAAAVETRPHPQVGISGAAAGLGPHPPTPFSPGLRTRLLASFRRGPGGGGSSARGWGRGAGHRPEATPRLGLARTLGTPSPFRAHAPIAGRGGAGVQAFPAFGREDLSGQAAPRPVASPRRPSCGSWGPLNPKEVPVAGNPGVSFVCQLKLEAGTVGKHPPAQAIYSLSLSCLEGILPGSLFSGYSSRLHASPPLRNRPLWRRGTKDSRSTLCLDFYHSCELTPLPFFLFNPFPSSRNPDTHPLDFANYQQRSVASQVSRAL